MGFSVVLDACVLYPFALRDALLYAAHGDLFSPRWSEQILDEMRRNLVTNDTMSDDDAQALVTALAETFPEAMVDQEAIDALVIAMRNDEKDRHVAATAVAAGSEQIVTINLKHFQPNDLDHLNIAAVHPDTFLSSLLDGWPDNTLRAIHDHADDRFDGNLDLLIEHLASITPQYAAAIRGLGAGA